MAHAEIRGRGRTWKVWVPDAAQAAHAVPVYDEDGNLKEHIWVGAVVLGDAPRMVETRGGPFSSIEEAAEYARYLGYPDFTVNKTMTKEQALAKAREARQKGDT
jgi:hypothetical protein